MTVIFDPKSKACHAAEKRNGFLCFLGLDELLPLVFTPQACRFNQPRIYRAGLRCYSVHHQKSACQTGFTLLEMLVVIGLIGIVALGSASMLIDDGDWKRQEETEKRWDTIRKAIIGEPNLSLNGSPYVAGYVADMGRLPSNLDELTALVYDYDDDGDPSTPNIDVPAQSQIPYQTFQLSTKTAGMTGELSGGWRGPYIYTAGSQAYRDAWDNIANPDTGLNNPDSYNFGWSITINGLAPDHDEISVQSVGNLPASSDDYPNPNMPIVSANEWQLNVPSIYFDVVINKKPNVGDDVNNLELRLYFFQDTGIEEAISTAQFSQLDSGSYPNTQTLMIDGPLPMGRYAAVVWCSATGTVYDGDCTAGNTKLPYYFTLLPSALMPITIPWNIP